MQKNEKKVGRNDPCPCGSGRKYKKCCLLKEELVSLPRIVPQRIIDEEAQRILTSRFNMRNGFIVRKLPEDYGIDYQVELIDSQGQTSGISFCVQLKGTNHINIRNKFVTIQLKKSTLNLFSQQLYPTIVIVVDISTEQGYWHNSFDFINDLDNRIPAWRSEPSKTATIHIPNNQDFSDEQLKRLKNYVEGVHSRRNAIPQGCLSLLRPFGEDKGMLGIQDLQRIVDSHDYDKFFQVISAYPFAYLSDINFSALYDIYQHIPPKKLEGRADAIATFAMACFMKGYHQEARKWSYLALSIGIENEELGVQIEYTTNVIDFVYGYKSEQDFLFSLDKIENRASKEMRMTISVQKLRIDFLNKEEKARAYGRYRSMKVAEECVETLWKLYDDSVETGNELILLEIAIHYSTIVPFYFSEIIGRVLFRQKLNIDLPEFEIASLLEDANKKNLEGISVFNALLKESEKSQISLNAKAEALLLYGSYNYNLQCIEFTKLIFSHDITTIPKPIPLGKNERLLIEQSLNYFIEARNLFKMIGAKDREIVALIQMLGCFEDLGKENKYQETKIEIERMIKTVLVPNTLKLYELNIREGSLRTRQINRIREGKPSTDFEKANMDETEIEMQVECNCKVLNISEKNRIENVRKDVISYVLAAKYRINVCKHFELHQDLRHTLSLDTLYSTDPNRKGVCKRLDYESRFVHSDTIIVIKAFKEAYCKNCRNKEPLKAMKKK